MGWMKTYRSEVENKITSDVFNQPNSKEQNPKPKHFIELENGTMVDKDELEESSYQLCKGTVERNIKHFIGVGDFNAAGIPQRYWHRIIKDLSMPEENFYIQRQIDKIELPGNGILISEFAEELTERLKKEYILFFRQDSRQVIELGTIKNEDGEISYTGFVPIKPSRFVTLIEKYFKPWGWVFKKSGEKFPVNKSMTKDVSNTVLESHILHEGIPSINRLFTVQLPVIYNGELTFPQTGYDKRFRSWLSKDAPVITDMNMSIEEAKKVLYEVFKEFCFETKQDYVNAISALLTPFIRGLFKTGFNTRAPVYCYEANRERSGKDYLAGVTGILYEGHALEEPPISNGEYRTSGGCDELRKKVIAAMISGKKRLHFSNNKGHLNNAVFESITTAERFTDRLLGKNQDITFDNEIDFSFSGNLGITLTPDLSNRTIFIKLFLDIEDANQRKFNNPNLHKWVLDNRNKILSALYSLVKNWFNNGCKSGSMCFASFPEWARVCGGIMESAGYDNPCNKNNDESGVSIDSDTDEMKELFELCYEKYPDEWIDKHTVKSTVQQSNIMTYLNWENRSTQTKFGIKLNKFVGRVLSDIRLVVQDKKMRSSRWKYQFIKKDQNIEKSDVFGSKLVTSVTFGNVLPSVKTPYKKCNEHIPNVTKDTKVTIPFTDEEIATAGYTKKELDEELK
jgi:hypothetical protein